MYCNIKHFVSILLLVPNENDKGNYEKLDEPLETFYPKLLLIVDYSHFE